MATAESTDCRPITRLDTDILVVGAGAAGVAAAVTAARQGLRVIAVERYGFCGGGAVAGMSGTICGLYEASQDPGSRPLQLVFGFADEFVRLMERKQGLTGPVRYGKTFTRVHDPLVWREAGDHLMMQAGVTTLFHSVVTDVLMEGDRVAG
ncbi:MAG TPA: FAD-dependent oxidoreductase, partial [Burkholderiaceae bacterium]|nr:FAD-dependent oxidoreductase [Burkholderiaceae bacterium]